MKTRGFYAILFVMILSLSGIEGCPASEEKTTTGAYIGGTDGLGISFVSEEPPMSVLDNNQDPFFITLLIQNNGEYTVPAGKIIASLSGINKDAFGLDSLNVKSVNDLFGKNKIGEEIIEGSLDQLQFDQANYKYDLSADFSTQLRADICYAYETNSLVKLCLKKNPIQRKQEDVCSVLNENVAAENSGAPLQIKDVRSRGGSDSVTFTFIVENKGTGEVYEPGTFFDNCIKNDMKKDYVILKIKDEGGKLDIKCGILGNNNEGTIKLINNMRTVSCTVKTSGLQESAFEEPFEIILDYFYKESISTNLLVVNSEY
jgi:hypothetical protein